MLVRVTFVVGIVCSYVKEDQTFNILIVGFGQAGIPAKE
jgi:hypothetical protein